MRHCRTTGAALAVLLAGMMAGPSIAQEGEAIDLSAGLAVTAIATAQDIATEQDSATNKHPVYDLQPEPYSDSGAMVVSLADALDLALQNNLGIKQQNLSIEKGHYSVDQTYYAFDPQVSGSLSETWSEGGGSTSGRSKSTLRTSAGIGYTVPREYGDSFRVGFDLGALAGEDLSPAYTSSLSLSYQRPLSQGAGKYFNRIPRFMASNNLLLSYDRLDDETRNLKKSVMDVFLQAVAARETIAVREASLDVALQQLERSVERYKVGLAIRAELLQAENSVLTQRAQLLSAQTTYLDQLDNLTTIIGLPQEYQITVDADTALLEFADELPPDLWNLVQTNSFELKSLNTQLANLRLQRDQQLHQLKPDLGLGVSYSSSNSDGELGQSVANLDNQSLGLNLNWATTPGKRSARASLAQNEIDLASLDLSIQDTELQLKTGLRSQQRNLTTMRQQIDIARGNLAVVKETYEIQKQRNEVGLATTLDVVDAQESVLNAELALLNARVAYQQAYREIMLSAGLI